MVFFLSFIMTFSSLANATSFSSDIGMSKKPYETLQSAFETANRAPTLDEIPWATDAYTFWEACIDVLKNGKANHRAVTLAKWVYKFPSGGPILETPEVKVNVLFAESPIVVESNENILQVYTDWHVSADQRSLIIYAESFGPRSNNYIALRTDGRFIYFSQVLPFLDTLGNESPSFGYCWKKIKKDI
ncbi:MAG: hypothetical protein ACAH59_08515 [Pseudobdellovibrionaceae bacterium]